MGLPGDIAMQSETVGSHKSGFEHNELGSNTQFIAIGAVDEYSKKNPPRGGLDRSGVT